MIPEAEDQVRTVTQRCIPTLYNASDRNCGRIVIAIRPETSSDHAAVREVNILAFGSDGEARLVERLRADGLVIASLVAVDGGLVVGHILFSELPIETEGGTRVYAASLAPMAVRPEWQRRGIGSALVREGLEACRQKGKSIAVVLGHPQYYPRFGFSPDLAKRLQTPYAAEPSFSAEAWMALELTPGALNGVTGTVRYPEEFSGVS